MGTFVRVSMINLVGWTLFATANYHHLAGIQIAAIALICSVTSEATFAHIASRKTVRERFGTTPQAIPQTEDQLTYRKLLQFHLPLTATTMVMLCGNLIVSAAISKGSAVLAELSLASWQVAGTLIWFCRTIVFALPEVVITLYKDGQSAKKLRDFSVRVGLFTTAAMSVIALFGVDKAFFRNVLGENMRTVDMAHLGFCCCIALPFIGALQSYVRGMLTAHHLTVARFLSVLVSVGTMVIMLTIGVMLHWLGVFNAAIALTVSMVAELAVLYWCLIRGMRRLQLQPN